MSPPPEVSPEIPAVDREAAVRIFREAYEAVGARWDLSRWEEESWRLSVGAEAVARSFFDAGVAAGRTQAADHLDQRGDRIYRTASSVVDRGLGSALRNVARELRELPEGQENT